MSEAGNRTERLKQHLIEEENYNRPVICPECGGIMVFQGIGEYKCEECGYTDYDDYGKTRNYIEQHPGATMAEVSKETGVTQKAIRNLLRECRLEVAPNSAVFLRCGMCGTAIRYGKYCSKCETVHHREIEEMARKKINMSGFSTEKPIGEDGAKRFRREA